MESFIKQVLLDLQKKGQPLQDLFFILPSKRARTFLKHELASVLKFPIFSPTILSIEELVEDLSGLKTLDNSELLFRLYSTYSNHTDNSELEPFDSFIKWAQILLQDFNEIDRYLVNQTDIFDYLSAIKELDHWSLESNQTDLIKSHLKFWKNLGTYYNAFTEDLIENKEGYQGLIYREAANNLEYYIETNSNRKHVFLGFNALNKSESQIISIGTLMRRLSMTLFMTQDILQDSTNRNGNILILTRSIGLAHTILTRKRFRLLACQN
jgi:hypothetical protein